MSNSARSTAISSFEISGFFHLISASILSLRSSYAECAFRSAKSFLNTFSPPARPSEFLEITTGSLYADQLSIDYSGICGDINDAWTKFNNSALFKGRKLIDHTNWIFVGDWILSAFCGGQPLPDEVTKSVFAHAIADWALYLWGPLNETRGVGASAILRPLFATIDDRLSSQIPEKFFLFSGHETPIAALLNALGVQMETVPPFRSHLALEIWAVDGTQKARFVLNGEPVPIDLLHRWILGVRGNK
jgi:acid phosphatase